MTFGIGPEGDFLLSGFPRCVRLGDVEGAPSGLRSPSFPPLKAGDETSSLIVRCSLVSLRLPPTALLFRQTSEDRCPRESGRPPCLYAPASNNNAMMSSHVIPRWRAASNHCRWRSIILASLAVLPPGSIMSAAIAFAPAVISSSVNRTSLISSRLALAGAVWLEAPRSATQDSAAKQSEMKRSHLCTRRCGKREPADDEPCRPRQHRPCGVDKPPLVQLVPEGVPTAPCDESVIRPL